MPNRPPSASSSLSGFQSGDAPPQSGSIVAAQTGAGLKTCEDSPESGVGLPLVSVETSRLLSIAARLLSVASDRPLRVLGLSPLGFYTLEHLMGYGPLGQTDLATHLYVRPQTAGHLLARLEQEGLVTRTPSGMRRANLVSITAEGRSVFLSAQRVHRAQPSISGGGLSAPQAGPTIATESPRTLSTSSDIDTQAQPKAPYDLDQGSGEKERKNVEKPPGGDVPHAVEALRPLLVEIIVKLSDNHSQKFQEDSPAARRR